jgi:hypothetical protein
MFERFTDQSHRAVVLAQEEARRLNHDHVGTEHLLAGLLREERGTAALVLGSSGVTLDAVRGQIAALAGPGQEPPRGHIAFTARVLGALGMDLVALRAQVIAETGSRPEGQEHPSLPRPRMRPRRVAISDPVQALLDSIDDRLSAIERHLGMSPGGPENVIPPS